MRILLFISLMTLISFAFAEEGRVLKLTEVGDAYLLRGDQKIKLDVDSEINSGDTIFTRSSRIVIHLFPSTQIGLAPKTEIRIAKNLIVESEKGDGLESVIEYLKGMIRLQVTKGENEDIKQSVQAKDVAFAVRGTDFEVSTDEDDIDLDVFEGEVEVSSPHVMTFVPEIVKSRKGFRFNGKKRTFATRKFSPRFKDHLGFLKKEEIRERWMKKKRYRKEKRLERRAERKNKRSKKNR